MILTNDFHHTRIQVNLQGRDYLTARQVKRAQKALCVSGCTCGGVAGERPAKQHNKDGDGACYLVGNQEGGAFLMPW